MRDYFDFDNDEEIDALEDWLMYNAVQDSESSDCDWNSSCDVDSEYDWRDSYDDDYDNNIFPEGFDTEEDYLEALEYFNREY